MNIRPYQESNQKVVCDMMLALNAEDKEELPLNDGKIASFFTRIQSDPDLKIYIAEENGSSIGYATLASSFSTEFGGRYVEIEELYISPEFRNKGFGKEFVASLEQISKKNGANSVFLVASSSNQKAQKLYENLGYKQLPRIEYIKFI